MSCLGWILNLGFGGGPVPAQNFTGSVSVTINSSLLAGVRLYNHVYPMTELKAALPNSVTIMLPSFNMVTLSGNGQ